MAVPSLAGTGLGPQGRTSLNRGIVLSHRLVFVDATMLPDQTEAISNERNVALERGAAGFKNSGVPRVRESWKPT